MEYPTHCVPREVKDTCYSISFAYYLFWVNFFATNGFEINNADLVNSLSNVQEY